MSAPAQPNAFVIDASIAVQLVLEEPCSPEIETFVFERPNGALLLAPSILANETAAAITKKLRRKEIDLLSARKAFSDWRQLIADELFDLVPANNLLTAAFELSISLHHPLHDCLYVALAQSHKAAIVTRDVALARKARQIGIEAELISA